MRTLVLVAALSACAADPECTTASTNTDVVSCTTSAGSAGICVTPFDPTMNGPGPMCAELTSAPDFSCPNGTIVVGRTLAGAGYFVCEPGVPPKFPP